MNRKYTRYVTAGILVALIFSLFAGCAQSHVHNFGEWEILKEATCTQEGQKIRSCSCGEDKMLTIEPLGHTDGAWVTTAEASCTDPGHKEQRCARCAEVLRTEDIAALDHKEGDWEITEEPSCKEDGQKVLHCELCDAAIRTEQIPTSGNHAYTDTVTKAATCQQNGIKTYTCRSCSDSYTEAIICKSYTSTELYDMYINSVGEIITYDVYGSEYALGTGFVYTSDGRIVTNYHVIEGAYSAKITLAGKEYTVTQVLAYDKHIDLAVLKINATGLTPVNICNNEHKVGSTVYAIGSSLGLTATFSDGMITYANRVVDDVSHVQHDAPISSGNSGGPLINVYGEVIGINTWTYEDSQNLNFAISVNEIKNLSYSNPMTMAEFYEAEGSGNDVFSAMRDYIMAYGEWDTDEYGDYYYLVLATDYSDGYEFTRAAYYYAYDNTITLDCIVDNGEYWAYFTITDEVSGEYEWVYFDDLENEMIGTLYADSFTEDSLLSYSDYYIASGSTLEEIRSLASTLIDLTIWTIDIGFEDIGVTAYDLHFYYYE